MNIPYQLLDLKTAEGKPIPKPTTHYVDDFSMVTAGHYETLANHYNDLYGDWLSATERASRSFNDLMNVNKLLAANEEYTDKLEEQKEKLLGRVSFPERNELLGEIAELKSTIKILTKVLDLVSCNFKNIT